MGWEGGGGSWDGGRGGFSTPSGVSWVSAITWGGGGGSWDSVRWEFSAVLGLPELEGLSGLRGRGSCLWQGFLGPEDLHGVGSIGVVGGQDLLY